MSAHEHRAVFSSFLFFGTKIIQREIHSSPVSKGLHSKLVNLQILAKKTREEPAPSVRIQLHHALSDLNVSNVY